MSLVHRRVPRTAACRLNWIELPYVCTRLTGDGAKQIETSEWFEL